MSFGEYRTVTKPRKSHKCEWCHQAIDSDHLHFIGKFEGEFQSWRIHKDCRKPMEASGQYEDDYSICPGPHVRAGACKC